MPNSLLREARFDVENFGHVRVTTAARLEALGYDVAALEERLLKAVWR